MGKTGIAAFIIDVCSTSDISSFGRLSSGGSVGAILCFLLFILVRRLSLGFRLQQINLLQSLEQHPLCMKQKLTHIDNCALIKSYFFSGSLKLLLRLESAHAIFSGFGLRFGKQKQHLPISSPSFVLSILFVLRQHKNLSIHKRHLPLFASTAPSTSPTVDTLSIVVSDIDFIVDFSPVFLQHRLQNDCFSFCIATVSTIDLAFDVRQHRLLTRVHGIQNRLQHGVQHFDNLQHDCCGSSSSPFSDL